jgi:molecular chaperone Hsp33
MRGEGVENRAGLPDSSLYTFIDGPREFALYFLEGQRLILDLARLHPIRRDGFAYFREVVLSVQPMIALLKHGEQFGFYIDSAEPYFRLKIETAHNGATRCMLLPAEFQEFPEAMRGIVRVLKLSPNDRTPYESVLRVEALPLKEIVNRVLRESYQVHSAIMVSRAGDQSLLLHQLPPLRREEYEYSPAAVQARWSQIGESVDGILARTLCRRQEIETAFEEVGFRPLARRTVRFRCSCSRAGMVENVRAVYLTEGESLFDPGQETLEVTCEYCKRQYRISQGEVRRQGNPHN